MQEHSAIWEQFSRIHAGRAGNAGGGSEQAFSGRAPRSMILCNCQTTSSIRGPESPIARISCCGSESPCCRQRGWRGSPIKPPIVTSLAFAKPFHVQPLTWSSPGPGGKGGREEEDASFQGQENSKQKQLNDFSNITPTTASWGLGAGPSDSGPRPFSLHGALSLECRVGAAVAGKAHQ